MIKIEQHGTYSCKAVIQSDNSKMEIDLAEVSKDKGWHVDHKIYEEMIAAGVHVSRFNKVSDVDTVFDIFCSWLNEQEQKEFLEKVAELQASNA